MWALKWKITKQCHTVGQCNSYLSKQGSAAGTKYITKDTQSEVQKCVFEFYTKSSNSECLLGSNTAEGAGKLQCVLHFSLLLTMGDSRILLEATDLCTQQTFQQGKELFYL